MNLKRFAEEVKLELQISPLIDVVFLLLIYFIVTSALIKKEGDISFMLPAESPPDQMIDLPVEIVIQISAEGLVEAAGIRYQPDDIHLPELAKQIKELQLMARAQRRVFFVNLLPDKGALHRRIVNVMDACHEAEVEHLSFSKSL